MFPRAFPTKVLDRQLPPSLFLSSISRTKKNILVDVFPLPFPVEVFPLPVIFHRVSTNVSIQKRFYRCFIQKRSHWLFLRKCFHWLFPRKCFHWLFLKEVFPPTFTTEPFPPPCPIDYWSVSTDVYTVFETFRRRFPVLPAFLQPQLTVGELLILSLQRPFIRYSSRTGLEGARRPQTQTATGAAVGLSIPHHSSLWAARV